MKPVDVRAKTDDELKEQVVQLTKEQFNLRFQRANGTLENTARAGVIRRDVARIKTVLGERKRGVKIETKAAAPKAKKAAAPKKK